jgi:hypothetical protein
MPASPAPRILSTDEKAMRTPSVAMVLESVKLSEKSEYVTKKMSGKMIRKIH